MIICLVGWRKGRVRGGSEWDWLSERPVNISAFVFHCPERPHASLLCSLWLQLQILLPGTRLNLLEQNLSPIFAVRLLGDLHYWHYSLCPVPVHPLLLVPMASPNIFSFFLTDFLFCKFCFLNLFFFTSLFCFVLFELLLSGFLWGAQFFENGLEIFMVIFMYIIGYCLLPCFQLWSCGWLVSSPASACSYPLDYSTFTCFIPVSSPLYINFIQAFLSILWMLFKCLSYEENFQAVSCFLFSWSFNFTSLAFFCIFLFYLFSFKIRKGKIKFDVRFILDWINVNWLHFIFSVTGFKNAFLMQIECV